MLSFLTFAVVVCSFFLKMYQSERGKKKTIVIKRYTDNCIYLQYVKKKKKYEVTKYCCLSNKQMKNSDCLNF